MTEGGADEEDVVIPKKKLGARSRISETTSQQRSRLAPSHAENLPARTGQDDDRPSYSREYLEELRNSTPSTPQNMMSVPASDDEGETTLDIRSKFGELAQVSRPSAIPSEAQIREKKERRARLAKEEDFISVNDVEGEEDNDWPKTKKEESADTRLVRDDENFAEGFDEFVEDGRISLGKRAEREQKRRQRAEMKELIEGEKEGSSDVDDSEAERNAAYEATQTRAGMDGLRGKHFQEPWRPKTPPKISSIPRLSSCLTNLRVSLSSMENNKVQLVARLEQLREEKVEISVREAEIQKLLKEAGDNYEKLRGEASDSAGTQHLLSEADEQNHRGLESLGTASLPESVPNGD